MAGIVLAVIILGYTGFVIYKKAKAMKKEKSCCCGCSSCSAHGKCGKS